MHTKYFDNHFDKAFLMATKPTSFSGIFITDWRFGFMIGYMIVLVILLLSIVLSSCNRLICGSHSSISCRIEVFDSFELHVQKFDTNSNTLWLMESTNKTFRLLDRTEVELFAFFVDNYEVKSSYTFFHRFNRWYLLVISAE